VRSIFDMCRSRAAKLAISVSRDKEGGWCGQGRGRGRVGERNWRALGPELQLCGGFYERRNARSAINSRSPLRGRRSSRGARKGGRGGEREREREELGERGRLWYRSAPNLFPRFFVSSFYCARIVKLFTRVWGSDSAASCNLPCLYFPL